jgi:hypothetical protein
MSVQSSVSVRNATLDARVTAFGANFRLQVRSGAQPASCAAAAAGALLVEFTGLGSSAASNGTKAITGGTNTAAVAAGTAGHYRIVDSAGTTCHEQGSIGLSGDAGPPDLIIDNPSIRAGQICSISGWTLTASGS